MKRKKLIKIFFIYIFCILPTISLLAQREIQKQCVELFNSLDTMPNVVDKKLTIAFYKNGNYKELGVEIKVNDNSEWNQIGLHLTYYKNGQIKDSMYAKIETIKIRDIEKSFYKSGNIKKITISKNVSISEGLKYTKNRTKLSDYYVIEYYENSRIKREFGYNIKPNSKIFAEPAVCHIQYKKNGDTKKIYFID